LDEWTSLFELNVTAAMRLAQQFVPAMARDGWGRVINVSSRAGRGAGPNSSPAYMASKAALLGLTRSIASEFAPHGVTANSVAPGMVETDMAAAVDPLIKQRMMAGIPVGRTGNPAEIGALIAFLVSEEAGYITGACIDANGGAFMC
ncbi:MAG: SDR family oxidoreductase, partial [Casimicrobiaceae bacterium]